MMEILSMKELDHPRIILNLRNLNIEKDKIYHSRKNHLKDIVAFDYFITSKEDEIEGYFKSENQTQQSDAVVNEESADTTRKTDASKEDEIERYFKSENKTQNTDAVVNEESADTTRKTDAGKEDEIEGYFKSENKTQKTDAVVNEKSADTTRNTDAGKEDEIEGYFKSENKTQKTDTVVNEESADTTRNTDAGKEDEIKGYFKSENKTQKTDAVVNEESADTTGKTETVVKENSEDITDITAKTDFVAKEQREDTTPKTEDYSAIRDDCNINNIRNTFVASYVCDKISDCMDKNQNNQCDQLKGKLIDNKNRFAHINQVSVTSRSDSNVTKCKHLKQVTCTNTIGHTESKNLVVNMSIFTKSIEAEHSDNEFEHIFQLERMPTHKKEYELEIIAGQKGADDISLGDEKRHEPDWKLTMKKIQALSSRVKRSLGLQRKKVDKLKGDKNNDSMEELENITSSNTKISKTVPVKAPSTATEELPPLDPLSVIISVTSKGTPQAIPEMLPKCFDLYKTETEKETSCITPVKMATGHSDIKDEPFVEIDHNFVAYEVKLKKMMYEMNNVLNCDIPQEKRHQSKLEILRDSVVTSRFISLFRQEKSKLNLQKFINVLFVNVNQPKIISNERYYIPGEDVEIIEEIYTHSIVETIICEDVEIGTSRDVSQWILDDEWMHKKH